jgi:ABC-type cobalamin/Fe3+-siderophores transport system ATPase subunit
MNKNEPPAITISKLCIRYQKLHLFDNLDFHLPAQKWTCLLGPSGIGKTTLLRFIAALPYEKDTECVNLQFLGQFLSRQILKFLGYYHPSLLSIAI